MKDFINIRVNNIKNFFRETEEYQDKNIEYVLYNSKTSDIIIGASDGIEKVIEINSNNEINNFEEWDFNFDNNIFENLEKGYEIEYMSDDLHLGIWNSIKYLFPNDIQNKNGFQKYIIYCKDNDVTKEYLINKKGENVNNIIQYLEDYKKGEHFNYKGYVVEVDETNFDNINEQIVNIYKNYKEYLNGNILTSISLDKKGLKEYAKIYIDNEIIDIKSLKEETNYFAFVLAYDLLKNNLDISLSVESDRAYDFCKELAEKFVKSDEFYNYNKSSYDMLKVWLNNNKEYIVNQYRDTIQEESYDNKKIKNKNKER